MSDPVTNVEIEDVLSSIRRLVSENARSNRDEQTAVEGPLRANAQHEARENDEAERDARERDSHPDQPGTEAGAASATHAPAGMLVLTPDRRIEQPAAANADEAETAGEAEQAGEPANGPVVRLSLSDMAELAAAADAVIYDAPVEIDRQDDQDQYEANENESSSGDAAAGTFGEVPEATAIPASGEEEAETAWPEFSHANAAAEPEVASLEDRIAGLEAAVAQRDDQWEPDGEGDGEYAAAPIEGFEWDSDDRGDAEHVHGWEHDEIDAIEADLDVEPDEEAKEALPAESGDGAEELGKTSSMIEADAEPSVAPENVVSQPETPDVMVAHEVDAAESWVETGAEARQESQPEPEADLEAEAASEPALARPGAPPDESHENGIDERHEPEAVSDLEETEAPSEAIAPELLSEDTSVIDEEMLRDMVAEIVRLELQGTLGERITRNVRKLVRREIHRALTARELE